MERILNKAKNHEEAEKWNVTQEINMTPEERQKIAKELKRRFYGTKTKDMRGKTKN